MASEIEYLEIPLPEDIQKMKWHGDFARLPAVIDRRLQTEIPQPLKKRLELEKEILARMPGQYPYSWDEACRILRQNLRDFQDGELETFWEDNMVEWIYREGNVYFHRLFLSNLFKTRPALAARRIQPAGESGQALNRLDAVVSKMKRRGHLDYHFHLCSTLRIAEGSQRVGEKIRVHLPIPVEYAQVRHFRLLSTSMEPTAIAPPEYPQRTVCFDTMLQKDQAFSVEYEYDTHMVWQKLDDARVLNAQPTFYTQEQPPHVRFTPYLRELTRTVIAGETNPMARARKIYEYITSHVMYSFVRSYSTIEDLTAYVATGFKGDCGIQALLFITMCRIAGVPARWQAGLYVEPGHAGDHDWAQFYVAPYGWLFADCSFGGAARRAGAMERWNFYFGCLDPFRMPAAAEFQHEFYVPTGRFRSDPYDNQEGEAAYADGNLSGSQFSTEHEVLEICELES